MTDQDILDVIKKLSESARGSDESKEDTKPVRKKRTYNRKKPYVYTEARKAAIIKAQEAKKSKRLKTQEPASDEQNKDDISSVSSYESDDDNEAMHLSNFDDTGRQYILKPVRKKPKPIVEDPQQPIISTKSKRRIYNLINI